MYVHPSLFAAALLRGARHGTQLHLRRQEFHSKLLASSVEGAVLIEDRNDLILSTSKLFTLRNLPPPEADGQTTGLSTFV
jgi:hypothetical protein